MHLFILTTALVLLPQVCTLKCWSCYMDKNCIEKECEPEHTRCVVERSVEGKGDGNVRNSTSKSCASAKDCVAKSFNYGELKARLNRKCCSSDLCNTIIPDLPITTANGKKCPFCDGSGDCSRTLNCEWIEDQCFTLILRPDPGKNTGSAKGETTMLKGCASKSMCNEDMRAPYIVSRNCTPNSASPQSHQCQTSASLLGLVATLISVLLLSN